MTERTVEERNYLAYFVGKYRLENGMEPLHGEEYNLKNLRAEYMNITELQDLGGNDNV